MLLISAFKPFGLKGLLTRSNASLDVLALLRELAPTQHRYVELEVNAGCTAAMREALEAHKPTGVVAMGEHMLCDGGEIVVEPHALKTPVRALPLAFGAAKVVSAFASRYAGEEAPSHIGTYYCNAVYREALQWASRAGDPPVAFIHIPVLGHRAEHARQVRKLMWEMLKA